MYISVNEYFSLCKQNCHIRFNRNTIVSFLHPNISPFVNFSLPFGQRTCSVEFNPGHKLIVN